jgi:hypothetical protein
LSSLKLEHKDERAAHPRSNVESQKKEGVYDSLLMKHSPLLL